MPSTVLDFHGPGHRVVAGAVARINHVHHVHHSQRTFATNGVGRAEVVAHGKVLASWEVNLSVARHSLVLRRHIDGGASKGTHGTLLEGELRTNVVLLVTAWENLSGELTADDAVCGQLGHQHAVVVAGDGVGLTWRGQVPTSSNGVVHHEAVARFEGIRPSADHRGNASINVVARGCPQSDVRIECRVWCHHFHGRADRATHCCAEWALVEAGGGAQLQRKLVVA